MLQDIYVHFRGKRRVIFISKSLSMSHLHGKLPLKGNDSASLSDSLAVQVWFFKIVGEKVNLPGKKGEGAQYDSFTL